MNRTPRAAERKTALLCILLTVAGCMQPQNWNRQPYGSPVPPLGGIPQPQPHYGYKPITPIGYTPFPVVPGTPVVLNPFPTPGAPPSTPTVPPGTTPTDPITNPTPSPGDPPSGYEEAWSHWPLPPKSKLVAARTAQPTTKLTNGVAHGVLSTSTQAGSVRSSGLDGDSHVRHAAYTQPDPFARASADRTLKYRGGHLIRDLQFVNLYVSGDTGWAKSDINQIQQSLLAAVEDEHLNNVLRQYFNNQTITATELPPHFLVGYVPERVTRGDIENYILHLDRLGYLRTYNLQETVFNLMLPSGTILSDSAAASHTSRSSVAASATGTSGSDAVESTAGLAGYHGSVAPADGRRIYFAVSVYSERASDGRTNGIPVFDEPWKNVTATLYHQLMEVRTDPDVEDALRTSSDLNSDRILGWVSDTGLEIGDVFSDPSVSIKSIIREVPLADGSGSVPIQLPYSNAVKGVEGPISQPHPL